MSNDIVIKPRVNQPSENPTIELTGSSGGIAKIEVTPTGDLQISGSSSTSTTFLNVTKHEAGLSGSLTRLTDNTSFLRAGTGIDIITGSGGWVTISSTAITSPASPDTSIQFNNNSSFDGDSSFTFTPGKLYLTGSFAQGEDGIASGNYSHAEGSTTTAEANYSHAEGKGTLTAYWYNPDISNYSGEYSHAEGYETIASGSWSHAEGEGTKTIGDGSHAEGYEALSFGEASHAEGKWTETIGVYSHAEGVLSIAGGTAAHSEGSGSIAMGTGAHSEGHLSSAPGDYSHAEGWATITSGSWSHAEGKANITSGSWSHAEGIYTIARGEASHAEGSGSLATGKGSHAEGKDTTSLGDFSHAAGLATLASGYASFAIGSGSVAAGNFALAMGEYVIASGSNQTVLGKYNKTLNADSLFVVGNGAANATRNDIFLVNSGSVMVESASLASDTIFYVGTSGLATNSRFDGNVVVSGTLDVKGKSLFSGGLSGSLQSLVGGEAYLKAGTGITISTGSSPMGQITIASNIAPGGSDQQVQFNNSNTFGGDSTFTFNNSTKMLSAQNVTLAGDIAVNGGDVTTTSATFNIGNTSTSGQTLNIATAATAASQTKNINLGTNGILNSITNITIGPEWNGDPKGETRLRGETVYLEAGTGVYVNGTNGITSNIVTANDIKSSSGTTMNIGHESTSTNNTLNIGTAVTTAANKTINIGTGGTGGSTAINIGATNAGDTTINSVNTVIQGDLRVVGELSDTVVSRNIRSLPNVLTSITTTSTTFSTSSLNRVFGSESEIPIADLDVGDTIKFYSTIQRGAGSPGTSAVYASIINLGTSTSETSNIISKISNNNNEWYEIFHDVTLHVLAKTISQLTVATSGIASNVWNSETSSTSPTIIPRVITLSYSTGQNLFFVQRGIISGHDLTSWTQVIDREVDKTLLYKF
jgi:hypothetical protein